MFVPPPGFNKQMKVEAKKVVDDLQVQVEQAIHRASERQEELAEKQRQAVLFKKNGPKGWVRSYFLVGDLHGRHADGKFLKCCELFLKMHPVDVLINGGDVGDFESMSRYGGPSMRLLKDDIADVKALLVRFKKAAPNAQHVLLQGNHDDWMQRTIAERMPQASGLHTIQEELNLEALGIKWIPQDKQPYVCANEKLRLIHGHQELRSAAIKNTSAKMLIHHGLAGSTVIYFHTHKHQDFQLACSEDLGGTTRAIGLGCGRNLRPDWLDGESAGWVQEFAIVYEYADHQPDVQTIRVTRGSFTWGGKVYSV